VRLSNKLAVVTGSAQGIGRSIALRLAEDGADLVLMDLLEEGIASAAELVREAGRRALAVKVDCTDDVQVGRAFARARSELGQPDILVNNVGQSARERNGDFHLSQPDRWRFVINVSLMTTLLCSRHVVADMRNRRAGKIVNISSDAAFAGAPGAAEYGAAKAGVVGFTRALAMELAPFGVNVNAVSPGTIGTDAMLAISSQVGQIVNRVPLGRTGRPEEVAGVVAFLAGPDSDYMTGQTLLVDGGRWMV
jgi:NAD(P)-dependent dehydrogenase (short-subunit alcohol dehydrogenase family)